MLSKDVSLLFQDKFISDYLQKNRAILITSVNKSLNSILFIDLSELPITNNINFPELLLRWIISVNKSRLEKGLDIIITYDIIKKCPIWKIVGMPIKSIKLDKQSLNKSSSPTPTRKTRKIGSINR
jgi:hypothetical protein